jgi:hypothetical protein
LDITSAALPVLVKVTDWGLLEVSTDWSGKLRLTEDKVTAGTSAGAGTATVPPAPHEVDRKTSAMQAVARIAVFARRRFEVAVSMRDAHGARMLPISVRVPFFYVWSHPLSLCPMRNDKTSDSQPMIDKVRRDAPLASWVSLGETRDRLSYTSIRH